MPIARRITDKVIDKFELSEGSKYGFVKLWGEEEINPSINLTVIPEQLFIGLGQTVELRVKSSEDFDLADIQWQLPTGFSSDGGTKKGWGTYLFEITNDSVATQGAEKELTLNVGNALSGYQFATEVLTVAVDAPPLSSDQDTTGVKEQESFAILLTGNWGPSLAPIEHLRVWYELPNDTTKRGLSEATLNPDGSWSADLEVDEPIASLFVNAEIVDICGNTTTLNNFKEYVVTGALTPFGEIVLLDDPNKNNWFKEPVNWDIRTNEEFFEVEHRAFKETDDEPTIPWVTWDETPEVIDTQGRWTIQLRITGPAGGVFTTEKRVLLETDDPTWSTPDLGEISGFGAVKFNWNSENIDSFSDEEDIIVRASMTDDYANSEVIGRTNSEDSSYQHDDLQGGLYYFFFDVRSIADNVLGNVLNESLPVSVEDTTPSNLRDELAVTEDGVVENTNYYEFSYGLSHRIDTVEVVVDPATSPAEIRSVERKNLDGDWVEVTGLEIDQDADPTLPYDLTSTYLHIISFDISDTKGIRIEFDDPNAVTYFNPVEKLAAETFVGQTFEVQRGIKFVNELDDRAMFFDSFGLRGWRDVNQTGEKGMTFKLSLDGEFFVGYENYDGKKDTFIKFDPGDDTTDGLFTVRGRGELDEGLIGNWEILENSIENLLPSGGIALRSTDGSGGPPSFDLTKSNNPDDWIFRINPEETLTKQVDILRSSVYGEGIIDSGNEVIGEVDFPNTAWEEDIPVETRFSLYHQSSDTGANGVIYFEGTKEFSSEWESIEERPYAISSLDTGVLFPYNIEKTFPGYEKIRLRITWDTALAPVYIQRNNPDGHPNEFTGPSFAQYERLTAITTEGVLIKSSPLKVHKLTGSPSGTTVSTQVGWTGVTGKPFNSVGANLTVNSNDELTTNLSSLTIGTGLTGANYDGSSNSTVAIDTNVVPQLGENNKFQKNITIEGDLTVNGTEFIANTETVEIEDNLGIINSGETGDGITAGFAGWEVDRGTEDNFLFGFQESNGAFSVGKVETVLQAIATREDSPTADGLGVWDSTNNRFSTYSGLTWDGTILTANALDIGTTGHGFDSSGDVSANLLSTNLTTPQWQTETGFDSVYGRLGEDNTWAGNNQHSGLLSSSSLHNSTWYSHYPIVGQGGTPAESILVLLEPFNADHEYTFGRLLGRRAGNAASSFVDIEVTSNKDNSTARVANIRSVYGWDHNPSLVVAEYNGVEYTAIEIEPRNDRLPSEWSFNGSHRSSSANSLTTILKSEATSVLNFTGGQTPKFKIDRGHFILNGKFQIGSQTVIDSSRNFFGENATFNQLAKVGSLEMDLSAESSSGYTSGILGAGTRWDMNTTGGSFFEVDNMRVRNELRAHIFKKDIVKASNAYLFITDAAEIAEEATVVDTTDTFRIVNDGTNASFSEDDLLWAKNIQDDGSLDITGVKITVGAPPTGGYVTGTTNDKNWTEYTIKAVENGGTLNAGDTIVRVSGGNILNDASSQYAPFIDIYDGVSTWAEFQDISKTKVRLGNLEGQSSASGYGLYTQNAFLTGSLLVGDLTKGSGTGSSGKYLEYSDGDLTGSFGTISFDASSFALTAGDMTIDSSDGIAIDASNYFKQDKTFSFGGGLIEGTGTTLSISGANASINVSDFTLTAGSMTIDSGSGVVIDTTNYFKQDKTFSFGGGLLEGTKDTLSISGAGVSLDISDFTLNATSTDNSVINLGSNNIILNGDGSGQLAGGNIDWTSEGALSLKDTDIEGTLTMLDNSIIEMLTGTTQTVIMSPNQDLPAPNDVIEEYSDGLANHSDTYSSGNTGGLIYEFSVPLGNEEKSIELTFDFDATETTHDGFDFGNHRFYLESASGYNDQWVVIGEYSTGTSGTVQVAYNESTVSLSLALGTEFSEVQDFRLRYAHSWDGDTVFDGVFSNVVVKQYSPITVIQRGGIFTRFTPNIIRTIGSGGGSGSGGGGSLTSVSVEDLTNTDISSRNSGDYLRYVGDNVWTNQTLRMSSLVDTGVASTPSSTEDGFALTWNDSAGEYQLADVGVETYDYWTLGADEGGTNSNIGNTDSVQFESGTGITAVKTTAGIRHDFSTTWGDGRYGRLGEDNTWQGLNEFNDIVSIEPNFTPSKHSSTVGIIGIGNNTFEAFDHNGFISTVLGVNAYRKDGSGSRTRVKNGRGSELTVHESSGLRYQVSDEGLVEDGNIDFDLLFQVDVDGNLNLFKGSYRIGSQTVIDSSRRFFYQGEDTDDRYMKSLTWTAKGSTTGTTHLKFTEGQYMNLSKPSGDTLDIDLNTGVNYTWTGSHTFRKSLHLNDGDSNRASLGLGPLTDGLDNTAGSNDTYLRTRFASSSSSHNIHTVFRDAGGVTMYGPSSTGEILTLSDSGNLWIRGSLSGVSASDVGADNYNQWMIQANSGASASVGSNETVTFQQAGDISITRSGRTITISADTSSSDTYVNSIGFAGQIGEDIVLELGRSGAGTLTHDLTDHMRAYFDTVYATSSGISAGDDVTWTGNHEFRNQVRFKYSEDESVANLIGNQILAYNESSSSTANIGLMTNRSSSYIGAINSYNTAESLRGRILFDRNGEIEFRNRASDTNAIYFTSDGEIQTTNGVRFTDGRTGGDTRTMLFNRGQAGSSNLILYRNDGAGNDQSFMIANGGGDYSGFAFGALAGSYGYVGFGNRNDALVEFHTGGTEFKSGLVLPSTWAT